MESGQQDEVMKGLPIKQVMLYVTK